MLSWCFHKKDEIATPVLTNQNCNDYIQLMQCIEDKTMSAGDTSKIPQILDSWKDLSESELNNACSQAMDISHGFANDYEKLWCSVPWAPTPIHIINTGENNDWEDDSGIISWENLDVISAINAETVELTTSKVVDADTAHQDSENISSVIDSILTAYNP